MKIIIVGGGKTGTTLAHSLCNEGHDVTVIEKKKEKLDAICDRDDVMGIVGNGLDYKNLEAADMAGADILIAVTASDQDNLLCCLFGKKRNCETIARVRDPLYIDENDFIKEQIGLNMIINPEYEAAKSMSKLLKFPSAVEANSFFEGTVEMLTFRIRKDSALDGEKMMNIRTKMESEVLFCTVERDGDAYIPQGDFVLNAGDKVTVVINPEKAAEFFSKTGVGMQKIRNVMIAGGGVTGYYLAKQLLEEGIKVCIIEVNGQRCEELAEALPDALVIHGDASDKQVLTEEHIEDYDAFMAMTGFDEENIMLSLYAKETSDAKVVTKIDRTSFTDIISKLDLDSVIYPRTISDEMILKHVRAKRNAEGSNVEKIYKLADDAIHAIEFKIAQGSAVSEKPLKDLRLKDSMLIAGVFRAGKQIIPDGNTVIKSGDRVIVVTKDKTLNDVEGILK